MIDYSDFSWLKQHKLEKIFPVTSTMFAGSSPLVNVATIHEKNVKDGETHQKSSETKCHK